MQIKTVTVHARVEERHELRLRELAQQSGLRSTSAVLRLLIENARLELRPQPTTVIELPVRRPVEFVPTP